MDEPSVLVMPSLGLQYAMAVVACWHLKTCIDYTGPLDHMAKGVDKCSSQHSPATRKGQFCFLNRCLLLLLFNILGSTIENKVKI